jgi:type VI secretion system protein ImpA
MALDLDALASPLSEDKPSGEDLCYDEVRGEIERAFDRAIDDTGDGERKEKDWRRVTKLVLEQAGKTRDIWLPVYLMRAGAMAGDLEQVVDGAQLLARLVEDRWGDLHPQLDDYGFVGRKTPCESLVSRGGFLKQFSAIPVVVHKRFGAFTGDDVVRLHKGGAAAPGRADFALAIDGMSAEEAEALLARFDLFDDAIRRADAVMTENAEGDTSTNFKPLYELAGGIRAALAALLPVEGGSEEQASDDGWDEGPGASSGGGNRGSAFVPGAINSRAEAIQAIDAVSDYFTRHEPSSPVPFALRRAKEWISLDFISVLEDIAPGSVGEANRVLRSVRQGSARSEDWNSSGSSGGESPSGGNEGGESSSSDW